MRKSAVLLKQHTQRHFELQWKLKSKRKVATVPLPQTLLEQNVKIIAATELAKQVRPIQRVPEPEKFLEQIIEEDPRNDPLWHKTPVYKFCNNTKLIEGVPQIQVLFKTVVNRGVPDSLQHLRGSLKLTGDQDALVRHRIKANVVQDATQVRLPWRFSAAYPTTKSQLPRKWGIPSDRKVRGLSNAMLQLCSVATATENATRPEPRIKMSQSVASVFIQRGSSKLWLYFPYEYALLGRRPLNPFDAHPNETIGRDIADIEPLSPLINVRKANFYNTNETLIPPAGHPLYPHLIGITHSDSHFWLPEYKTVKAVASCFAMAVATAKKLYGSDVASSVLPVPVSMHCVLNSERSFWIISYQLNTLDFSTPDGVKNQVWIDGPHKMYEKCEKYTEIEEYNPLVFDKILTTYANCN